jgi:hypothetical protein
MEYYHTLLTIGSQAYRFISQNRDSLHSAALQLKFASYQPFFSHILKEAEFLTHCLHSPVLYKHIAGEVLVLFIAPELDHLSQQPGFQSLALELVGVYTIGSVLLIILAKSASLQWPFVCLRYEQTACGRSLRTSPHLHPAVGG